MAKNKNNKNKTLNYKPVKDINGDLVKPNRMHMVLFNFFTAKKIKTLLQIKKLIEANFSFKDAILAMLQKKYKKPYKKYYGLVKDFNKYQIKKDPEFYFLIAALQKISEGSKASDCFEGWVGAEELLLIRAGEEKDLSKALELSVGLMRRTKEIKSITRKSAVAPLIYFTAVNGLLLFFAIRMSPILLDLLPLEQWPGGGRALYNVSDTIYSYWYLIYGIFIALMILMVKTLPMWANKGRDVVDGVFIWDVYRRVTASTFVVSLSTLLKSGVKLSTALQSIYDLSSKYQKRQIAFMLNNLKQMGDSGQALTKDVTFLRDIGDEILIYSQANDFADSIEIVGNEAMDDTIIKVESMSKTFSGLLKLAVFGVVVWVLVTFFSITNEIQSQQETF